MNIHAFEKYTGERKLRSHILAFALAILIPVLLAVCAFQADRHTRLFKELRDLENEQISLVEKNRELISEISVLSSSDRIGRIAERELQMHKASKEEIVRVEITGENKR